MTITWLVGLYGPVRDITQALTARRPPKLAVAVTANSLGGKTWVVITARNTGAKPVTIRGCIAELYVRGFDSCTDAYPVRTRNINFTPQGRITICPGETPVRWEAQVYNDHIRREAREQNTADTLRNISPRHWQYTLDRQDEVEQLKWRNRNNFLPRLERALTGPENVKIRAVIETIEGGRIASNETHIPPRLPFGERLNEAASLIRAAIHPRTGSEST